jgi:hypothetical protein
MQVGGDSPNENDLSFGESREVACNAHWIRHVVDPLAYGSAGCQERTCRVHSVFMAARRGDLHIKPFLGELRAWKATARREGKSLTDWIRARLNQDVRAGRNFSSAPTQTETVE